MRILCSLIGLMLASSTACRAQSPEQVALIETAVSSAKAVEPASPRKVLVIHRCDGFRHSCIPVANKMLALLGEHSGAFEASFTDEMASFNTENLAGFDAILLNNTTRLKFENDEQRAALVAFVKGGKGLIGIHSASDNFYDFPEAAEMIGGMFDGHPWGAGGTWGVKLDDADHPINASFKGENFEIRDEIYQMKSPPYSRQNQHLLLSLNLEHAPTAAQGGQRRDDKDYGISWIKRSGKGRVFYCSLGHNEDVFWNKDVVAHYLAGIQYALGDLNANDSPSEPAKETAPAKND